MKRKKLKKYIGKSVLYSGYVEKITGINMLITNLYQNGKFMCDHAWVLGNISKDLKVGDSINFYATAYTYRDKHDVRGIGLRDAVGTLDTTYIKEDSENFNHRIKRIKKRNKRL